MTQEEIKQEIVKVVEMAQGCKGVDLASKVARLDLVAPGKSDEIVSLIEECVAEGRIIEIEYAVPNMPERIKSFYLPQGSKVRAAVTWLKDEKVAGNLKPKVCNVCGVIHAPHQNSLCKY